MRQSAGIKQPYFVMMHGTLQLSTLPSHFTLTTLNILNIWVFLFTLGCQNFTTTLDRFSSSINWLKQSKSKSFLKLSTPFKLPVLLTAARDIWLKSLILLKTKFYWKNKKGEVAKKRKQRVSDFLTAWLKANRTITV